MRHILIATVLAAPCLAQEPVTFTINQSASQWSWSGSSSLGPINGNPSTSFATRSRSFAA